MTSYGAFPPDADCADTRAEGYPGLDPEKIELLTDAQRAAQRRARGGRARSTASPSPIRSWACCARRATDGLGPDLQGMTDPFPFHPTGIGSLRMASAVVRHIAPVPAG